MKILKVPVLMITSYKEVILMEGAIQKAMQIDNKKNDTEHFETYKTILSSLDIIKQSFRQIEIESGH